MRGIHVLIIVVLLCIFFTPVTLADNIEIDPEVVNIGTLYSGCKTTVNINITWTGSNVVTGKISNSILPDGEGITITYSEDEVTLKPGEKYTIQMNIKTSPLLLPQSYNIKTIVTVLVSTSHHSIYTPAQENMGDDEKNTGDGGDDDEKNSGDEEKQDEQKEPENLDDPKDFSFLIWLLGGILGCIFLITFLLFIKRKKSKGGQND